MRNWFYFLKLKQREEETEEKSKTVLNRQEHLHLIWSHGQLKFWLIYLDEFLLFMAENLGGATQHMDGNVLGKKPRVKNSSLRMVSSRGRSSGFSLRSFWSKSKVVHCQKIFSSIQKISSNWANWWPFTFFYKNCHFHRQHIL